MLYRENRNPTLIMHAQVDVDPDLDPQPTTKANRETNLLQLRNLDTIAE